MAVEILVGTQIQALMTVGLPSDYTFVSSVPNKAPVDVDGIVTGIAAGTAIITVTRISDGQIVDRVRVFIRSPLDSRDSARPYAVPTLLP